MLVVLLQLKETKPLLIVHTLVPQRSELNRAEALEFIHIVCVNAASEILKLVQFC